MPELPWRLHPKAKDGGCKGGRSYSLNQSPRLGNERPMNGLKKADGSAANEPMSGGRIDPNADVCIYGFMQIYARKASSGVWILPRSK